MPAGKAMLAMPDDGRFSLGDFFYGAERVRSRLEPGNIMMAAFMAGLFSPLMSACASNPPPARN